MNLIKLMWCRFQQCLGTFTMLLVTRFSQAVLLKHLSGYVFGVRNFEITKSMKIIFFDKLLKISSRFQKCSQKLRKTFCFWDNSIWIGIVKLSELRTGYFSSAANVLTISPKIWHFPRETFCNSIDFAVINEYGKCAVNKIESVLGYVCHVSCQRVISNRAF